MARRVDEILNELFKGNDSALAKYAKVRMTEYEMSLWKNYGLPLSEVDRASKTYFRKRFLKDKRIEEASNKEITEAFVRLGHAVRNGTYQRCRKLIEELNDALDELGLEIVKNPDVFLDYLTFDYQERKNADGGVLLEPGYAFPIRVFYSEQNRRKFWKEIQAILKHGRIMSMQDILRIVRAKARSKEI